ncbi:hypothetical protein TorRG33x02_264310 [Trema orientale]|uniref:Uncharacterized protein n=1 Tax=Trema orientale TaxID=63057 RepID=A0A2P5D2K9_TREOI|nr:hypothetical protein TorRG33x02_264310 [Trema orientale]
MEKRKLPFPRGRGASGVGGRRTGGRTTWSEFERRRTQEREFEMEPEGEGLPLLGFREAQPRKNHLA